MRQACPILFNIVLKFLARERRHEEEITGLQIGKEVVKLSLFADELILSLRYPENSRNLDKLQVGNVSKYNHYGKL
jgi:hypothetical protein